MSSIKKKKKLWKLTPLTLLAEQEENQMLDILNKAVKKRISHLQLKKEEEKKNQTGLI